MAKADCSLQSRIMSFATASAIYSLARQSRTSKTIMRIIQTGALAMMSFFASGCATNFVAPNYTDSKNNPYYESGDKDNPGYQDEEASQFIEFCVDLDNQDDRLARKVWFKNLKQSPKPKGNPPAQILPPQNPTADEYKDILVKLQEAAQKARQDTGTCDPYTYYLGHKPLPQDRPDQYLSDIDAIIDSKKWVRIYDSRERVANDVDRYFHHPNERTKDDEHWAKLYNEIRDKAVQDYSICWNRDVINEDPNLNGFGPWQNAWTLYKGVGKFAGSFAVAIRGTVFSNKPSVDENLVLDPVDGQKFLSAEVNLAGVSDTSLHGGFAHATFTLMLDERYGILHVLRGKDILSETGGVPDGARLYIIGHSQGAAMATMSHAFMHYALRRDNNSKLGSPVFSLQGAAYRLKSYGFAQPKPGNYTFAADFARITQKSDNAIVINNAIDPVPKVPLTLQGLADLDSDVTGNSIGEKFYRGIASIGGWVRHTVATNGEKYAKKYAEGYSYYYNYPYLKPLGNEKVGDSWDFVPAGRIITVFGDYIDNSDSSSMFFQHHATTYRELIKSLSPTLEAKRE